MQTEENIDLLASDIRERERERESRIDDMRSATVTVHRI